MVLLTTALLYFSVSLEEDSSMRIEKINLSGNRSLDTEHYCSFARLEDVSNYKNLTLNIIKDRLTKHPYVNSVTVSYEGKGVVSVRLAEKSFEALTFSGDEKYLISSSLELLPFLKYTRNGNYPVLNNYFGSENYKIFSSLFTNNDVKISFKMLTAMKLLNQEMINNLSEIDLRNGKDILLHFSNFDFPVVIGRGNEVTKIAYLNILWSFIKGRKETNQFLEYLDLRYGENIYLGLTEKTT